MSFKKSETYRQLVEKAVWSHQNRRSVFHIEEEDIARARLYSYGYRTQTIGAFHACHEALEGILESEGNDSDGLARSLRFLDELVGLSILPVPADFRVLLFTLYFYDLKIRETIASLDSYCAASRSPAVQTIRDRFIAIIEQVPLSNGVSIARDNVVPEQGTFQVPTLGFTLVPLVYGDHHSWSSAYVTSDAQGKTTHRHRQGVEIHLGFSPIHGRTILGDSCTELLEGYAMPIPAMTDHGFDNLSQHKHLVPFVFGSATLGGWGVFFDVEPRPKNVDHLREVSLDSTSMNKSVYLEREISRVAAGQGSCREVLIPSDVTTSPATGGLEMGLGRVAEGLSLTDDHFRIVSLRSGTAEIKVGPVCAELQAHDHVGIPGGMESQIVGKGEEPVLFLDAFLVSA